VRTFRQPVLKLKTPNKSGGGGKNELEKPNSIKIGDICKERDNEMRELDY